MTTYQIDQCVYLTQTCSNQDSPTLSDRIVDLLKAHYYDTILAEYEDASEAKEELP